MVVGGFWCPLFSASCLRLSRWIDSPSSWGPVLLMWWMQSRLIFWIAGASDVVWAWLRPLWAVSCRWLCAVVRVVPRFVNGLTFVASHVLLSSRLRRSVVACASVVEASEIALDWREGRGSTLVDVEHLDVVRAAFLDRLDSECVDVLGIPPLDSLAKALLGRVLLLLRRSSSSPLPLCSFVSSMASPFLVSPRRTPLRVCGPRFAVWKAFLLISVRLVLAFVPCLGREPRGSPARALVAARLDRV